MTKKVLLIALILIPAIVSAGNFTVGASASMYKAPNSDSPSLMLGLNAGMRFNDYFQGVANIEWTQYKENNSMGGKTDVTLIPITIDLVGHPLGIRLFDPYFGGGLGYYYTLRGDNDESTVGAQFQFGVHWKPTSGTGMDFKVEYRIPDLKNAKSGAWSLGGGASGTVGTSF